MAIALRKSSSAPAALAKPRLMSQDVWHELTKASFAVVGYSTPSGEPRSSGVVYSAVGERLYFTVAPDSWKARHIASSHEISMTVPVRRGGVLALVFPIPPATISFHATATVHPAGKLPAGAISKELEALVPPERRDAAVVIEAVPCGDFVTYGIRVPITDMAKPALARATVPVAVDKMRPPDRDAPPRRMVYAFMALALAGGIAGIWMPPATIVAVIGVAAALIAARHLYITHKALRMWLFVLESFIALTAIQGGAGLLRMSFDLPESWLSGSLFADYVIPGAALLAIVGGANALAAATVFVERRWALLVAGAAGLFMAGYEVVEIVSIDRNVGTDLPVVLAAQLLWLLAGVAVAALSALLWIRDREKTLKEVVR